MSYSYQSSLLRAILTPSDNDSQRFCVTTVLRLAQTDLGLIVYLQKESIMSKGQDSKKNTKKKPLLTPKEKKAAKAAKKPASTSLVN